MTALTSAVQSFIADGFADDCDELIHQCLQETPVTFRVFCNVYRKMQMSCIFHDRQSGAEIAELTEEVINIAKYYMLANTSNFEETVTGLFLVYALVTTQPFTNFAHMRLVAEDVPLIERIEQVARREKRLDVLYVLGRLLVEHTRYHAAARERAMEATYRKYLEGNSTVDVLGLRPKGVFLRQNEELEVIKELSALQLRYNAAKGDIKALKYTDSRLPDELDKSLRNLISGIVNDGVDDIQPNARNIKEKAMRNKVEGIKHLMAVNERSPTKRNSAHKSDIKSSPGKVKTGSPKKTTKKNQTKRKTVSRKRKRSETSDEELSEISITSNDDSDSDIDIKNDIDINNGDDIRINNTAEIDLRSFDKPTEANEIVIDSNNIKFEQLPTRISSIDNGQSIEIEIIDKTKCNKERNMRNKKSLVKESAAKNTKDQIDKRLRNTHLKSRLKRLGIDKVADFINES